MVIVVKALKATRKGMTCLTRKVRNKKYLNHTDSFSFQYLSIFKTLMLIQKNTTFTLKFVNSLSS